MKTIRRRVDWPVNSHCTDLAGFLFSWKKCFEMLQKQSILPPCRQILGGGMIPDITIKKAQKLLDEGFSIHCIAKLCSISHMTVKRIKSGERYVGQNHRVKESMALDDYKRCPECGGMVIMPCRACGMKVAKPTPKRICPIVLGLDLLPEHQERYEEVRSGIFQKSLE